ncbi:AMP-binding protein [Acidiferrimicrobium sp. IK]|uniref:AMP-binding protein n=1 Tax=Acidiferrimicrobium sp. IK TaxID=2871700 RepID=UPI0021CB47F0|nr:AMP-binding protein [Acidiferrimicrobium sp. IK]MCU4186419.1 AMP-binding protein [Acidiferrimicrobium sp. IK]
MTDWNYAQVWNAVAETFPEREALVQGRRRRTWAALDRRSDGLGAALVESGLGRQAKVAQYLYNSPEYLESVYACFKASLVPVNTNYRYTDDELVYLWDNADVEAVIFHAGFAERVERVRQRAAKVRCWVWVDDDPDGPGSRPCPEWAIPYEQAAGSDRHVPSPAWSGDDMIFVYTGGTTGMPKGVMWRQDDLFHVLNAAAPVRFAPDGGVEGVKAKLAAPSRHAPSRLLPGPPLMHGTGLFTAMQVLAGGGTVVMPASRHFDPAELLELIEAEKVSELSIVGDAFAKPILAALDAEPDLWDISSLWLVMSSGVIWSREVKEGLLRHNPRLVLADNLGSSEAVGMARSTARAGQATATAGFALGPDTKILGDDGREVEAGSGAVGRLAMRGRGPVGYYKDEAKSASTFVTIDGQRWVIPGDFATVDPGGAVRLLGRGSVCINTGGEKVFAEEVEEVLKLHPAVRDAVVVGTPHDRFGEVVTAVVEAVPGVELDRRGLTDWGRGRLADYKLPRQIVLTESIGRSPSGKVDYAGVRAYAVGHLSSGTG